MQWQEESYGLRPLVGRSAAFVEALGKLPVIARCDASVLISGETGTGKEVCAQRIHQLSPRARQPFVPVNCGAIPVELAENELFGHERGAFTGARATAKPGLIREAEGGTLFLDEIDSLPALIQVKLLRFLQDRSYRPLGATTECRADVRVIAATGLEAEAAVRAGRLRQDLYYRLNVIALKLPPLRERREDIPVLARHFLRKYALMLAKPVVDLSPAALERLARHAWPGNVRELEHVIERALILCEGSLLHEADISLPQLDPVESPRSFKEAKERLICQFERAYIQELLLAHQGNVSQAARAAHKHRRAFWALMRKHRIDPQTFKASS